MATHSSILAWRTPQPREPGGAIVRGVAESRTRLRTGQDAGFTPMRAWVCGVSLPVLYSVLGLMLE